MKAAQVIWYILVGASFFSKIPSISGQSAEENMIKYWKHREQLKEFVWEGVDVNATIDHGSYLMAALKRTWANCYKDYDSCTHQLKTHRK